MKNLTTHGALVAAMAAGLFASALPAAAHASDSDKVICAGANACKGKGACRATPDACAGKNGCKGQGKARLTAKECADKGGHPVAPVHPTTPKK